MLNRFRAASIGTAVIAATLAIPGLAGAQSYCVPASGASVHVGDDPAGVMQRQVSLNGRGVSLREALDRLAAAARVRFSYAADLLDLTRPVCLQYQSAPLGRVLDDLLAGAPLRPVVIGTDHVVLVPVPDAGKTEPAPMLREVSQLDRVVVTGSTTGASQRSVPVALDVVTGQQLSQRGAGSLSAALDGTVPGLWLWEQSPLSLMARYGSIRGASSFGVSYPKVYVDGVEVANSLLVTHLDPDAVSRIEVIRGPQGAALYGADAISGVMNIVTRQEGTDGGAPRAEIRGEGGASTSDYSVESVLHQNHAASLRYGRGANSARAGVSVTRIGAFIPGAGSQQLSANGGLRFVSARTVFTSTFRMFAQDARTPTSPVVSRLAASDSSDDQSVRQFTLGASAIHTANDRWTHSLVAGIDGYRLHSAALPDGAFPSAIDSALHAATGEAVRTTVRTSSVGQFGEQSGLAYTVTLAAEHSWVRDMTTSERSFAPAPQEPGSIAQTLVDTRSNVGVIGQLGAAYRDALFMTAGLRVERNTGLDGFGEIARLPMIGLSTVTSLGPATVKLRSAYGRGIRPVQTSSRSGTLMGLRGYLFAGSLAPEQQSGVEIGADAFLGRNVALHLTRFDQRATGLVQPVSVAPPGSPDSILHYRRFAYELQNVGEITNRGWELQGSVRHGSLSLAATFSQVDSRVRRVSAHYSGDLLPGDRMLEVPSRTFGLGATYNRGRWITSWNVTRATDWINYDRIALLGAFANEEIRGAELVGAGLRSFWRTYEGATRLSGRFGVNLSRGMTFTLDGENLLGEQRGEPDNVTVVPGRTLSAGLRVSF